MDEDLVVAIDWYLDEKSFKEQINNLVCTARKEGKVITLPLILNNGISGLELITSVISSVSCDGCDAPCCRSNPYGKQTLGLISSEYLRLEKIFGSKVLIGKGLKICHNGSELLIDIPLPCPFLDKNNKCSIYNERPLVCVLYPFQPGGSDNMGNTLVALAVDCKEARKIAKRVYLTYWNIRKQYRMLKGTGFFKQGVDMIFDREG